MVAVAVTRRTFTRWAVVSMAVTVLLCVNAWPPVSFHAQGVTFGTVDSGRAVHQDRPGERGSSALSGIVTDALTGAAISGAVVRVAGTTTGSAEVTAIADSRGRFVVVGLPAGDYGVRASLMGFFESRYGLDRPAWPLLEAPLPTVSLGPEQWRQDLGIRLWRLASLSGRVTDTRGRGEQLRLDLKARSFSSRFAKLGAC